MTYEEFIAGKRQDLPPAGLDLHVELHASLFPFQADIVQWALRRGRAAIFADTGLGKTRMQLEWARHVAAHADAPVLIFAPLAVAQQTAREGAALGLEVNLCREGQDVRDGVNVTNYERLDRFNVGACAGVVLDESSILKSFMGKTKRALVQACADVPFRLACTATPAPNDHLELGNHAEFLGVLSSHEMIARWFIVDTSTFGTYRLKGHAVEAFWDWVASWAVAAQRPSDLGYSDEGYVLPDLRLHPHVVGVDLIEDREGRLFRQPEMSATALHKEKRRTLPARVAKVAELVHGEPNEQWVVWCETDYEADALKEAIPSAVEVRGSHTAERKEQVAIDFVDGKVRTLISKPTIFGWGLNWQHVARVAFVGASYSYEAFYQAVRRSWRFGQRRPVDVHVAMAQTELAVWDTLAAKRDGHDEMRSQMSAAMRRARARDSHTKRYAPEVPMVVPVWLRPEAA